MTPDVLLVVLLSALALAGVLLRASAAVGRKRRSGRARTRARRAVAGEARARRLLRAAGYRIEAAQPRTQLRLCVEGAWTEVELRADFLCTRAGRRYVADAKTGAEAPGLGCAATRRQLLEYRLAYPVDGALLVDAERGHVLRVEFEAPGAGVRL